VKEGFAVRALVRPSSQLDRIDQSAVELVTGDMTDGAEAFAERLDGVTHVFHCAALVDDWAERDEMVAVNVTGLEHLLSACVDLPVERIVVVSSLSVYGLGRQENLDETAPLVHTGDNYNYTKILAEEVCRELVAEHKLPVVIVRPPYIYGEGDRQFFPRLCASLRDGEFVYLQQGEIPLELVYVGNVVEAIVRTCGVELAPGEDFIVTDGAAIDRRYLVETICKAMGYEQPTGSVPVWVARLLCPLFEFGGRVLPGDKPPKINKFRLKFMGTHLTFDIGKSRRLLGYSPVFDPGQALIRSIAWFAREHPEYVPGEA